MRVFGFHAGVLMLCANLATPLCNLHFSSCRCPHQSAERIEHWARADAVHHRDHAQLRRLHSACDDTRGRYCRSVALLLLFLCSFLSGACLWYVLARMCCLSAFAGHCAHATVRQSDPYVQAVLSALNTTLSCTPVVTQVAVNGGMSGYFVQTCVSGENSCHSLCSFSMFCCV